MRTKYPVGTRQVQRPRAYRLLSYLRFLGWLIAFAAVMVGMLALVQILFHPFDLVLKEADRELAMADRTLSTNMVAGVSIGSLVLVAAVAALPLMRKGVRRKQYGLSFWRGLLSSAIFLATDRLYHFVKGLGVLYFSATLAIFVAATIVLVEVFSRAGRKEQESDTRTELLASIVSGLVFGLLVQLGGYLISKVSGFLG
jgi:magnesium-transporting ATPase (P-type)